VTGQPAHVALSSFEEDAASLRAASMVLGSPEPDDELDRLYPLLLRHKCLTNAISHLERAGGDLSRLSISGDTFHTTWPLASLLPGVPEVDGRVTLASIRTHLGEHGRRLDAALLELADAAGEDPFVAIGGMSLRVAHPEYAVRMGYDVDVFAPDLQTGLRLLGRLRSPMGFALNRCRVSRLEGRWVAVFQTFRPTRDGHDVHLDMMAGGHPVGPGTIPLWFEAPLLERSIAVTIGGRTVRVPSAEDILLLMAVREQRRWAFTRRDVNDAGFLLSREGPRLDWDYLCTSARSHAIGGVLLELLGEAERSLGGPLIPPRARAGLAPAGAERWLLALSAAGGAGGSGQRGIAFLARIARRGWPVLWSFRYTRRERGRVGAGAKLLATRFQARAFVSTSRLARARTPLAGLLLPLAARLHPRLGSLCQLRERPSPPGGRCLSRVGALRRGAARLDPEAQTVLRAIGRALPDPRTQRAPRIRRPDGKRPGVVHRCRAFLYFLDQPANLAGRP
jgi:Uncharacterised nucleotidyltransferase